MSQATTDSRSAARAAGAPAPARRWALLIYTLFFLSGLTSLIYEVIWVRRFGEVFGVTTYATSTVLAAFFAGLALGSYFAGRIIDRGKHHPLFVYGLMEGAVGVYALLLPALLHLVEATYPAVYSQVGGSFSLFTLFRFLTSFAVLVIPTTLMGATLPVLSKLMVDRENRLGLNVGRLYAINTFGAVAGSISAGYFLIRLFGVTNTILLAALGNFILAAAAVLMSRSPDFRSAHVPTAEEARKPLSREDRLILGLAFTSGFAILALEVVWTKSLVLILGWTTYAFAAMLTAVLVGIALGSALFAPFADRVRNRGAVVAALIIAGGACAVVGPSVINQLPYAFAKLWTWTNGNFLLLTVAQFIICFLLVFVPTLLSGAAFPILVRMHSQGETHVGRTVADVYATNTFGGILGSLVGGFVLIRFFGAGATITVASLILIGAGGLLALALATPWPRGVRTGLSLALVAGVAVLIPVHPRFDTKLLYAGWGPFSGGAVDVSGRYMTRVLYHKEGVSAAVDVGDDSYGRRFMAVNAQTVASTYMPDMRALQMLGHLPVLLHPDPKQVLIIGLGAGVSSGVIATYPDVDRVTVVELNEEVPGGTAHFKEWNFDVVHNPKVKIVINDGANFVKATRETYDFISSDPIHPFISGNGILYSQDHWKVCNDRLRDGGVIAQWIPLYQLSPTDWATIIHTFTSVFPNSSMWYSGIDVVLIGFKGEVKVDLDRMAGRMAHPPIARDLLGMGIHSPGDVFGWFIAGREQLAEMGAGAPINTNDRPVLEYTAPQALSLNGVSSTMPALLTAFQHLVASNPREQFNARCTRPLTTQELWDASTNQLASQWVMRAMILDSNNVPQQYLQAMERARALRPKDEFLARGLAEAQCRQAYALFTDGYTDQALPLYQQAMVNDPTGVDGVAGALMCAFDRNDYRLARTLLDQVPARLRDQLQVLTYTGQLALVEADYAAARAAFQRVRSFGQESPMVHVGLGVLALKEGVRDRAYRHFDRARAIANADAEVLFNVVNMSSSHGLGADVTPYARALVDVATGEIAATPTARYLYLDRATGYDVLGERELALRDRTTADALAGWWQ